MNLADTVRNDLDKIHEYGSRSLVILAAKVQFLTIHRNPIFGKARLLCQKKTGDKIFSGEMLEMTFSPSYLFYINVY